MLDISNMRIFSGFSGDNPGASQSESDAQSENSAQNEAFDDLCR